MSHFLQDTATRFTRFVLTKEQESQAMNVPPAFLALLQNKIEAYANELVATKLPYHADPKQQVDAILEVERLRNFVDAYEELLAELTATAQSEQTN